MNVQRPASNVQSLTKSWLNRKPDLGNRRGGSCFPGLAVAVLLFSFPAWIVAQQSGGQTKANESAFTTDTLKAYLDAIAVKDTQIIALHKELSELRDKHAQDLRDAADTRYEQRFQAQEAATAKASANQNEFRGSLNDLSNTKVATSEFKLAVDAIKQQITDGAKTTDAKLADIQRRLDIKEGSSAGAGATWFNIFAVITAVCAIMGVLYLATTRRNAKAPWMDELVNQIKAIVSAK